MAPVRTQAERRASSERRVLEAAAAVIAEHGTTGVSFAEIARVAGCSHGLPSYLFGSKAEMLLALLKSAVIRYRDEMVPAAMRGSGGLEAVLGLLRAFLESLHDPLPYTRAIYVMIGEGPGGPPELRAALRTHHQAARGLLRDALMQGIEQGEIRPDLDVDAQAAALFGTLRGIGTQLLLDPDAMDVKAVTSEVLESTRRALAVEPSLPSATAT